jgi:hypothetical protein
VIPFNMYDPRLPTSSLRALVEANPNRRFALVGQRPDESLTDGYWSLQPGLVSHIERLETDVALAQLAEAYWQLQSAYSPPPAEAIKPGTDEERILRAYAIPSRLMGDQLRAVDLLKEARDAYTKAVTVDPSYEEVRQILAGLGR